MQRPGSGPDSLWSPSRRGLTIGLVLTITLVGFEAARHRDRDADRGRDLGDLSLYGWVFTRSSSAAWSAPSSSAASSIAADSAGRSRGLRALRDRPAAGGLATSMPMLIAPASSRVWAPGDPAIAYVAIGRVLPESLRPRMFAVLSTAWVCPGSSDRRSPRGRRTLGWRYVFLGLLPLIAVAGLLTIRAVSKVVPRGAAADAEAEAAAAERHRFPNALGVALGAGLVMLGLTPGHGGIIPWTPSRGSRSSSSPPDCSSGSRRSVG